MTRAGATRVAALVVAALVVAGCGSDGGDPADGAGAGGTSASTPAPGPSATGSSSPETSLPTPTGRPDLAAVRIRLARLFTLEQPLAMAVREGDEGLYFAEQVGRVVAVRSGNEETVLDLTEEVSAGGERGLLGMAFSPDGGLLYVNYTDLDGDTRVVEYEMDGDRPDPSTRREILDVDQPFSNHNGGHLAFGPDGYLYIGLGDGGSGGDPEDRAQSLDSLLGKMLRIDPRPQGGRPYGIPPDNPFAERSDASPEIWAYGLRNPWRYTFDRETGDLWIGDVGQNRREEVDFQPAGSPGGENYGWNALEGTLPFEEPIPDDTVGPIVEYDTSTFGCAVTGGHVYRGSRIPALRGVYLYADFCGGEIMALVQEGGRLMDQRSLGQTVGSLSSFGEGLDGELYVISLGGDVYRIEPA